MFSALNRPAAAGMAPQAEVQPITPACVEPVRHPVMLQRWEQLTFLHWRYDPGMVQQLLPAGLRVDVFDGSAWVGLIPFKIRGLRPPGAPAIPWLSNFAETNVRTYAVGRDRSRGVWFFSLDAARLPAVAGARIAYSLPYLWASMRVSERAGVVRYESRRRWPRSPLESVEMEIEPGSRYRAEELTGLDHFLTARYRLFTMLRGRLAFAQVEHEPWQLARASVRELRESLVQSAGLPRPNGDRLVHYSETISVKVGAPRILNL
jgi:uncharacterized protein YqjF (DUF2071 family)